MEQAVDADCGARDASAFVDYMQRSQLNERELLGVCKTLEASASVGQSQLDALWVCVGGYVGRNGRANCPSHTFSVLKPLVDAALSRLYPRMKSNRCSLTTFVETYQDAISVAMTWDDVRRLMGCKGKWTQELQSARKVTTESAAGQVLFGFVQNLLSQESLSTLLLDTLVGFTGYSATKEVMQNFREQLRDDLDDYARSSSLARHRLVSIDFLHATLEVQVTGAPFELELRMLTRIKAAAILSADSGVPRLEYEKWVLPAPVHDKFEAPLDVISSFKMARTLANDILQNHDLECVQDVQKLMSGASSDLLRLDASFAVELAYVATVLPKAVNDAMERCLLGALPSEEIAKDVGAVIAELELLKSSQLYGIASSQDRDKWKGLSEAMVNLQVNQAPAYELWASDPFFRRALHAVEHFVRVQPGEYGLLASAPSALVGKAAMRRKYEWITANVDTDDVTYASCDDLFRFPWLLSAQDQAKAKKLIERIVSKSSRVRASKRALAPAKAKSSAKASAPGVLRHF